MTSIDTLIKDINALVKDKGGWFSDELAMEFGADVAMRMRTHFSERNGKGTLRLSQMGPKCPCALWHSIHHPELAEPLPPQAEIKYAYGHIIEALIIALAKGSGHEVTGEQDELYVDGIRGHRDCVIDGCIVDVKSCSSYSFQKLKDGSIKNSDSFGYLDQLDGYVVGSLNDPLVRNKSSGYLLGVDKVLGHLVLYEHEIRPESIRRRIEEYKRIVELPSSPRCACGTVADGKSGNIKLDTRASYSAYKFCCFPSLRTFLYANGPVYLTEVVRVPDVVEVDKNGRIVR